jgi:hypothetical protein
MEGNSVSSFILSKGTIKSAIAQMYELLDTGNPYEVIIRPRKLTRTLEQNALLWSRLTDLSKQITWVTPSGTPASLTPEEWKDVMTAGLTKQRAVMDMDKEGIVYLGAGTRKMSIQQMIDLITIIEMFGANNDVIWSG